MVLAMGPRTVRLAMLSCLLVACTGSAPPAVAESETQQHPSTTPVGPEVTQPNHTAPPALRGERPSGPVFASRPTMKQASDVFTSAGVQPGQPLPQLSLVDHDGGPFDLRGFQGTRPLVLVTCSLTCNVARRQAKAVAELRQRHGDQVAVLLVYTIEAHPNGEACPYTDTEWVPPQNQQDDVLLAQPTTLTDRLALARRYARDWSCGVRVVVDPMANDAWWELGRAPNLCLVVDAEGLVRARSGWFDAARAEAALRELHP